MWPSAGNCELAATSTEILVRAFRVVMGVKQGDSGQQSKPVGLINLLWIIFIIAFIRTVIFKRWTSRRSNFYVICPARCQLDFSRIYL